jgi:hypothetical protein
VRKKYFILGRKIVAYTTAEREDTLPLFLLYPNIYSMEDKEMILIYLKLLKREKGSWIKRPGMLRSKAEKL